MAKLYIVMGCRIGGVRLVGGDSGANPGAHYISRSLERFFIRKIPWQAKNKQVLTSLIT